MPEKDKLIVEQWDIDKLIPYARNPRKNDEQVGRMVSAIKEFGFRIPVVAKSDGTIVDGHLRYKAAKKLGLKTIPVAIADDLSEAQIKAFRILANKSVNWADWDDDLLKLELQELQEVNFDLELTGFDKLEIDTLFDIETETQEPDEKYTSKTVSPIYEPTGKDVSLVDCLDDNKVKELLARIDKANISEAEKEFLRSGATRHYLFNYENIAEYYASKASPEMQSLMEDSALVIIDFDKAIENGFVQMDKRIKEIMGQADDEA